MSQRRAGSEPELVNTQRARAHQQVISAASCEDLRHDPLPASAESQELEDDASVLLHLVNQA